MRSFKFLSSYFYMLIKNNKFKIIVFIKVINLQKMIYKNIINLLNIRLSFPLCLYKSLLKIYMIKLS